MRVRLVSRGISGLVGGLDDLWGVLGLSFEPDISVVAVSVGNISHNLDTAVGKVDPVAALGVVTVASLIGLEVGVRETILNSVTILVVGDSLDGEKWYVCLIGC